MALTVNRLLADSRLGLTLVGGAAGTDRTIVWAHAIELQDPTPWLGGGELVMTTGLRLAEDPEGQREYVRRLSSKGAAALAVDTGTVHSIVPEAVGSEGDALGFPVVAVAPDVPFIAIGRAVADALAADDIAAAKRVVDQQQRLARAALSGGIPAVAQALAHALGADVLVLDARDSVLASAVRNWSEEKTRALVRRGRTRHRGTSAAHVDASGHVLSQSLGVAGVGRGEVLVATRDALHSTQRLLVSHAVSLISIELEKPAEVLTVERRLRAATLRALLTGALDGDLSQIRYFGFAPETNVVALVMTDVGPVLAAEQLLDDALAETRSAYLSMVADEGLVVILPARDPAVPEHVYATVRGRLKRSISAGLGSPAPLRDAVKSQRQAIAAARGGRATGRRLVRFDELGTYDLLLGGQSKEALEAVASSALGPLQRYDAVRKGDLVRSLEAFLAHNGQWESAAVAMGVHRHTMRNRMDKVTELLGRDVDSAHVRAELWLAVKAHELLLLETRRPGPTSLA